VICHDASNAAAAADIDLNVQCETTAPAVGTESFTEADGAAVI
jgi:hypothetical protein